MEELKRYKLKRQKHLGLRVCIKLFILIQLSILFTVDFLGRPRKSSASSTINNTHVSSVKKDRPVRNVQRGAKWKEYQMDSESDTNESN